MKGSVFRQCTRCSRRADGPDHDQECDSSQSTWFFRVDVGGNYYEDRKQLTRGGFATRREADRALREVLSRVDTSSYVPKSELTVGSFLTEEWLHTQEPPKVSANRYRNIRNAVQRHLVPALGQTRLQDLNAGRIERLYAALLSGTRLPGDQDDRGPLAPSTVRQIHGVIRKALRDAVKWGLVEQNVATIAEPPSNAAARASRRESIRIWTRDELRRFLTGTQQEWLHALWVLVATTGLRRGELAGLVDDSLDLQTRRLLIEWQLVPEEQPKHPGTTTPVHKPVPKSSAGRRNIDLDQHTVDALTKWLEVRAGWAQNCGWPTFDTQDVEACRLGHARLGHSRFLFSWPDGRHLNPDWISHEFSRVCGVADVPTIRLHDVRHTHASLLLAGGEQLKVVQERGGWASSAFLLDSYAHLVPGMQRQAADRFAEGLFNPDNNPEGSSE